VLSGGRGEVLAGLFLVVGALAAGLAIHRAPGANGFDRWGFGLFPADTRSSLLIHVAELGDLPVLVVGSVTAALVVVGRDRWRALACLCGPAVAAVGVEWFLKPLVGRHYYGVLSFPSGSVTTVAALATAWVLAVPRWLRWVVVPTACVVVWAEAWAVVGLRWHYPSDALGGVLVGVGTVLLLDGLFRVMAPPPVAVDAPVVRARPDPLAGPPRHPQL
jgi:undecaprenyl-diphosphatase